MLDRRKNSRSPIDPVKARKDFWARKHAEYEREIKLFGEWSEPLKNVLP